MRDCPPLPYQGGSSQPFRGVEDRPSPATPRSAPLHNSLLRQPVLDPYQFTESPIDYRSPNDSLRHATMGASARKYGRQGHDAQYYAEWDDTRKRDTEDEDEDADNMAFEGSTKRQKLNLTAQRHPFRRNTTPPFRNMQGGTSRQIGDSAGKMQAEEDNGDNHGHSNLPSTTSSRKQSVSGSIHGDERSPSKPKKGKSSAQMRGLRRSSLDTPIEDAIDEIEDDAHVGAGAQSSLGLGKGLRIYAQRVCERVEARGSTSYNELVQELFGGPPSEQIEDAAEVQGQENIRRRAYDALNVLEALNVISMVNKDIRWVGIEQSSVVREVSRCQAAASLSQKQPPEDGEDEESEEPEDDDMEIEELQRKVDAMRLQTELEQAKLQDQVTRHVQLTNLVKRNKRSEAKAKEREERHKKREEEKRAKAAAMEQDPTMTDVGPQGGSDLNEEATRKPERHRHRRSSRQPSERPQGQADEVNTSAMDEDQDEDSEEARRRRKQERRERRERKEKRAQRRQEREEEEERIQLPFVVVRMPGYTRASSDSESSISVVRRVREERMFKNSGKNRRHCESTGQETTMVEIQIPQQDDLSIISDTEILGDLGLNALTTDELEGMLPAGLTNVVQYTVNTERRTHNGDMSTSSNDEPLSITVRGGFEREIIRTVNEGASR
ncbi:Transcription factor Dp-2 [Dissophora globulifera]|nr:Transcription factor Dp-2 [Dissophora globulifera]